MWAHVLSAAIGIWLMVAPSVLGFVGEPAEYSFRIAGPYIATFAVCSWWQVLRGWRRAYTPAGVWLVLAPLFVDHSVAAIVASVASGIAVAALSFVEGKRDERYGGGWAVLWK